MSNQNQTPTETTTQEPAVTAAQLMEQIKAASIARKAAVQSKIEVIKLANELQYIESPQYEVDQVAEHDTAIVNEIIDALDAITDKKFTMYREFNFSANVNGLLAAVKTITLQKAAGFAALNQAAMLSPTLANFITVAEPISSELIAAMGRNTYFNKIDCALQHGEIGNPAVAVPALYRLARELGMANLDVSKVSLENLTRIEERSVLKAEQQVLDNKLLEEAASDDNSDTAVMDFKTK